MTTPEPEPIARAILALWSAKFNSADIADLLHIDEPRVYRFMRNALDVQRQIAKAVAR